MGNPTNTLSALCARWRPSCFITLALLILLPFAHSNAASNPPLHSQCAEPAAVGQLVSAQGTVEVRRAHAPQVASAVATGAWICPNDTVHVGERSRAAVFVRETDTVLRIDQNSTFRIPAPPGERRSLLDIFLGAIYFFSSKPESLEIRTPFVSAAVEGTEFLVRVDTDQATVRVLEGRVLAKNNFGTIALTRGQTAVARLTAAPRLLVTVRPVDAVQWALYYPPVLPGTLEDLPPELRKAAELLNGGDITASLAQLERIAPSSRTEKFYVLQASALLSVGRLQEAEDALAHARGLSPASSDAYALQTVIDIARNERDAALVHGKKAVELDPKSAAASVALSYAYQAVFDLNAARDTLEQGVANQPDDSFAWARLAELWLSFGETHRAAEAISKARALAPELSLTNTVLGFVRLWQIRIAEAIAAFEKAIAFDSANPLARLGLGLAKIRSGDLQAGTSDIEIAAALDPLSSNIRSYLGKAYYEETRDAQAAEQFSLAKELDPLDPTPPLYNAIMLQTQNRPVEALHELEHSIELNDNRAVYRSRFLLDQDLASRSASLGRIYRDLGFEQLALVEGWKSVNIEPSNFSGHRFLADTYQTLPRHEIARDSELLLSQLLQPININPVPPRLVGDGLLFLDDIGPSFVGFTEDNRLFAGNGVRLIAEGIGGDRDTAGSNTIFSGIYNKLSFSVGQFYFQTDGFRENNDTTQSIYNVFGQAYVSPQTSVQAEVRVVNEDSGDRNLFFFPDNFFPDFRTDFRSRSVRVGFRHDFAPTSTLIGSYVYRTSPFTDSSPGFKLELDEDAHFFEFRHLYRWKWLNLTAGFGNFFGSDEETVTFDPDPPSKTSFSTRHYNAYVYTQFNYFEDLILTLGVSGDFFDEQDIDRTQFNPKIGLIWNLTPTTVLRSAVFRALKRTVISSQTLEPTQVAGFNQFFDDTNATEVWRYGVAIDQKVPLPALFFLKRLTPQNRMLYLGAEFSQRDLTSPVLFPDETVDVSYRERLAHVYLYWTPSDWFSLSLEYNYERFDLDPFNAANLLESTTYSVPVGLRFFHPSGIFALSRGTYVHQSGEFLDSTFAFTPASDDFFVLDLAVGYRFPKRWGLASFQVRNVSDERFMFQDSDPANSRIAPRRQFLFRLSIDL